IAHLRVPVFPHLDEVLRVPLFQLGGDVATHLLSILATLVTAGLLLAWFTERGDAAAGWLASALFLSAPLVVQLATTGYVEALLTMFVTASFYALDRWRDSEEVGWLLAAGVFAGCSASVKYLGLFWVGVSFLLVLAHGGRRMRSALLFALAVCLALAPWYGRIVYYSGNPLFPFASGIFGSTAWDIVTEEPRTLGDRCLALVRLPWDLLFARERAGLQPPFSPFLLALIPLAAMRAFGNGLVRALLIITLAWSVVWLWLPADARYLEPAIPLACVAGTIAVREVLIRGTKDRRRLFAVAAIVVLSPSVLYALYRIDRNGAIPLDRPGRDAFLSARVPEYGAIAFMNARSDENDVAWLCGGEQLAYHYRGEMFGDFAGAARFTLLTSARDERELATRAKSLDARYLLIVKRSCSIPALESGSPLSQFARVYDDQVTTVYERTAVRNAD
ncbi:MAG: glycosyltransferase family 39 protein, partial [Acidobacteria bacterium]|nr:glycosyltransferase family 39 protein [Acidobacteriota bacterium]